MATIKRWIGNLLGRGPVDEARAEAEKARQCEEDQRREVVRASVTTIHQVTPPMPLRRRVV